jgi:phosphomannomutase
MLGRGQNRRIERRAADNIHLMSRALWLQSYSGVRAKVGLGPAVSLDDEVFAFRHAYCYAVSRLQVNPTSRARLVLARDPRPTGGALAAAQARGLATACHDLGVELDLIDLGVVPTPVWQHSVRLFEAHGGVMITASHNPIDENGWKYATGIETFSVDPAPPGALLSAAEMGNLIRAANAFAPQPWRSPLGSSTDRVARERAIANYVQFLSETYFAHAPGVRVVLDPNGGAACAVAERAFRALGVEPILVNDVEGEVAHEIDVEHARLDGTHVLDEIAQRVRSERALFGLAYDFDADRGNLTYVDAAGKTHIPSPQTAAAINTAIALAVHRRSGDPRRAAVVTSDATSCRVKQVAAPFGADFFEVETGEINVVTRMQDLEKHNLCAVVGAEGPNGGTVFSGTTCRDGTLVGAGALLAAADVELRAIVAETLSPGRQMAADLAGFIDLLPPQRSFMERRAAPVDWKATVDTFNRQLPSLFASELARTWERYEIVYSCRRHVSADRPDAAGYGWKARLFRPNGEGFLWIRGSKTEAGIARLVADAPSEPEARTLMDLGRRLLSMTDCGDQISPIDQRA